MTDERGVRLEKAGDEAAHRQLLKRYLPLAADYFAGEAGGSGTGDPMREILHILTCVGVRNPRESDHRFRVKAITH